eukprot:scaffold54405_cov55-Phaeocystis_antarctica.AAC.9
MGDDTARRDAARIVRTRPARREHIALVLNLIRRDRRLAWREQARAAYDESAAVLAAVRRRVVVDVLAVADGPAEEDLLPRRRLQQRRVLTGPTHSITRGRAPHAHSNAPKQRPTAHVTQLAASTKVEHGELVTDTCHVANAHVRRVEPRLAVARPEALACSAKPARALPHEPIIGGGHADGTGGDGHHVALDQVGRASSVPHDPPVRA